MENDQEEENSGRGGVGKKVAIKTITGGGMKTTILKLVMGANALTYFLIIFFGVVVIFSVFPSSSPASENTTPGNPSGQYFPVVGYKGSIPRLPSGGAFGALRNGGTRYHIGVDLGAPPGTKAVAVKDGSVVYYQENFYGGTDAVLVNHGDYVVDYTEIKVNPPFKIKGATIKGGEEIGTIIKNQNGGGSMLHFEMYKPWTTINLHWYPGQEKPDAILDPTQFLEDLLKSSIKTALYSESIGS